MNGKKVLVTGASGMLGSNLIITLNYKNVIGYGSEFDITNSSLVYEKLNEIKPDIIIHTAAFTNVEECEVDIDKAYLINSIGTQNIVNYCINKDILFIYISSTGIYGTNKSDEYTEFDKVEPTSIHHKSKYVAERNIQNHLHKYLILRTGWLYGGTKTHAKNFVYKRYLEAHNNDLIYSDDSQIGNPTFVGDLVKQIEVLINTNQYGVFNCVNEATQVTRYEYVKRIIELFEVNCKVQIASYNLFKRAAPVSQNESATNYKLNLLNLNTMGHWEISLEKYINQLSNEI